MSHHTLHGTIHYHDNHVVLFNLGLVADSGYISGVVVDSKSDEPSGRILEKEPRMVSLLILMENHDQGPSGATLKSVIWDMIADNGCRFNQRYTAN